MQKLLFIDRDGTLVLEPHDCQIDALSKIRICPGVIPALLSLSKAGFSLVMVTNQDGLGTVDFPKDAFQICHDFILELFASQGIVFAAIFICPHTASDVCQCRKPKTGLLDQFLQQTIINKEQSWVIGDRSSDEELAHNLGCKFLPIAPNHGWQQVTATILSTLRGVVIKRKTSETNICLTLTLDSETKSEITTPIAFFNHMLAQLAKHGGFSMQLNASGDVEVDDHHLIEDTAIVLGEAIKQALGDKCGIARFGFTLPMDESLAMVAIDLSGRSFCDFKAPFTREFVGDMAVEMVAHFFKSFAAGLAATMHISVRGENHHHMIEACFKALGRALRQAISQVDSSIPSTKGLL